jgi:hypothetical protein
MVQTVHINVTARITLRVIQQQESASVNAVGLAESAMKSVQLDTLDRAAKRNVLITCHIKQLAIM